MTSRFIHLSVHTEYALIDSLIRIKSLIKHTKSMDMPAIAVTDHCNLFAMVKFYRQAMAQGIKPIVGSDVWIRHEKDIAHPYRLTLLCKNLEGYRNLAQLLTKAYLQGQHNGIAMLEKDWIEEHSTGLIALSGGMEGDIGQALVNDDHKRALKYCQHWQRLFPDSFYIELVRVGKPGEETYVRSAVKLAIKTHLPVVASNRVCFIAAEDFQAHETRVCIHDGRTLGDSRRPKNYTPEQYLKSAEAMAVLFADIPQALENTLEIGKRCSLDITLGESCLPKFPVPNQSISETDYLAQLADVGLHERSKQLETALIPSYFERLKMELEVISNMGFPGYFLIVSEFINWAKENRIPVGPGRGSGAGSIVAWALGITDLDPIKYELLFERFLNPERVSMPDFDVDFCMDRRDEVIEHVADTYGRDSVSQIITYGTMAAKAVIRDVGRVLSHPYGFVDRIAKLIPFEIGMTLDKALKQEPELDALYKNEDEVRELIDLAKILEGLARNAGKHAGGVVIAPSKLTDFCPLYCEQGSVNTVTQFDKNDVEAVGLVKFDFLGLRTLTIIDWALETINDKRAKNGEDAIRIDQIPTDDVRVFDLLKRCQTTAVFQLESRGMKDLIKRLQPDSFEEIIALVALFRPGPLQSGMVDDFIDRKHGALIEYPHPSLETILEPTYGVILYQEQVMQIAQVLALYTLGGADLLRRAMGKKKPEEMAKQRSVFIAGAKRNNVAEKLSSSIFDLMEKFAGYGFNKSHSAAYALVSYQTAWLKTHYPSAFMAAVLSSDMDNTDKVVNLIEECRDIKLHVMPPDVNTSRYGFTVSEQTEDVILYGLGAIKGVGEAAIEIIIEERNRHGAYKNLVDFCQRLNLRKVNRRVIEALIRAGAMDLLGYNRASLMGAVTESLKAAEQFLKNINSGMQDLFGETDAPNEVSIVEKKLSDWDDETRLNGEKETLGLYLTGHPVERYESELKHIVSGRLASLIDSATLPDDGAISDTPVYNGKKGKNGERQVIAAGLTTEIRVFNTRRGRMAVITLDDRTGRIDITLFNEIYEIYQNQLVKDKILVVEGSLGPDTYTGGVRILADRLFTIAEARTFFGQRLVIQLKQDQQKQEILKSLAAAMSPFKQGECPVWVQYQNQAANAKLPLDAAWQVTPSDELLSRLRAVAGEKSVWLEY